MAQLPVGLSLQTQALASSGRGERNSAGKEPVIGISLAWELGRFPSVFFVPGAGTPVSQSLGQMSSSLRPRLTQLPASAYSSSERCLVWLASFLPHCCTNTGWQSQQPRGRQQEVLMWDFPLRAVITVNE